jgi:hypothetical protein
MPAGVSGQQARGSSARGRDREVGGGACAVRDAAHSCGAAYDAHACGGTQITCFTGTKGQILMHTALQVVSAAQADVEEEDERVLSLLALLVQRSNTDAAR